MSLTKLALKRPVSCVMIIIALLVFGISSIFGFKMELTPDMEIPMLLVYTLYPGADPESVEELVTKVIEDSGNRMSGVTAVTSNSSENYSMVMFQYDYGVNIDDCYNDLRIALDSAASSLPDDAGKPTIMELDMNAVPVLTLSATEVGDIDLLTLVEDEIVPELETTFGVAQVDVTGGTSDYIRIQLKPEMLRQHGLTMSSVANFLMAVDFTYPAGKVNQGDVDINISTSMEYNTVQLLRDLPVANSMGATIRLSDVAVVSMGTKDATTISRQNGHANVGLSISKNASAGTVNVCLDVIKKIKKLEAENPSVEFEITYDASESIIGSLTSVGQTLGIGVILSMLVLFLFFGDFRASMIVGSSIPISLFVTIILMGVMGFSMNIVTMGALVIAIGMMVDNSIVVLESCFRFREKGMDFMDAALEGTKEVTASIIASTITTVVVYLPLANMAGLSGQIFYQLGYTIVFAMLASLVSAMTLVPLFYTIFKPTEKTDTPVNRFLERFNVGYKRTLHGLLNKKVLVVMVTAAMIAVSVFAATTLNVELMPSADEGIVNISVSFRSGSSLDAKDRLMAQLESMAAADEDVESYTLSIGSGSSATLSLKLKKDRSMSTDEKIELWQNTTKDMTNMDLTISAGGSSMSSYMVSSSKEVDLKGFDREMLKKEAMLIADHFRAMDGVVNVTTSASDTSTTAKVVVNPLKAMSYGLTSIQVATTLNNVISGLKVLDITNNGVEYEVRLEYPSGLYDDLNGLMNLDIQTVRGTFVPLRDIASIKYTDAPESIARSDGYYTVSITSTLTPSTHFETSGAIDAFMADYEYPQGISPASSTMDEMMVDELKAIFTAILIAVFLVFLVMAMQFESPRFSFMVMVCIPFSLIGSFILMAIVRSTLSMVSMMGFLMLMGIVVNNGILYVDSTNMMRAEGFSAEDALVDTGAIRIRPILMTSLTTILSMIPMGLGLGNNGQMMQGMALVIIGGLGASTVLTLILLPTFYLIIDNIRFKKKAVAFDKED